ncbi:MAG TPA: ABC transporter ATP-binding protein [Longimicrobium sp.]
MIAAAPRASARVEGAPPPPREAVVRLEGLAKSFPVRRGWRETLLHPRSGRLAPALQGVTCDVAAGELFGLLGPNGAGKTTLFRILSTLVLPDAGTARVGGADVAREPARVRRLLAPVLTDERSLNWRLSARENLRLFAALYGLSGAAARARVDEVLQVVELGDASERPVGGFSSGMKQRLLLARALLARPRVLLLDEPTRSLDPISARRFRAFLRDEVVGRRGCTVILATHAADEAMELCDRVAVLDRGRLLAVGPAEELSRRAGRERYRVWTRAPEHPAFAVLARRGLLRSPRAGEAGEEGWASVDAEVPGGEEGAAAVLAALAAERVPVSRFERVRPTLAELIERIVEEAAP